MRCILHLLNSLPFNPFFITPVAVFESKRTNFVIATQEYEYKISNVMDKSLESVLGYITVLPGAFSAYRYEAIRGNSSDSPLARYFVSLTSSLKEIGVFKGNMFLAEDRILGFELLVREGKSWYMAYCNDSVAETDVPETLVDLLKQRRRWLNGSFFAIVYALLNFAKLYKSKHKFHMKIILTLEFAYLCLNTVLGWFIPANFMIVFLLLVANLRETVELFPVILMYFLLIMTQFVAALAVTPQEIPKFYNITSGLFGFALYLQVAYLIYDAFSDPNLVTTSLFILIILIPYVCAFFHGAFWPVLATSFQYYFMLPTLLNTFLVFAFCNTHDLSWGTKGLEAGSGHGPSADANTGSGDDFEADKKRDDARRLATDPADKAYVQLEFSKFRTSMVMFFIFTNGVSIPHSLPPHHRPSLAFLCC
jgi:chitin synthase